MIRACALAPGCAFLPCFAMSWWFRFSILSFSISIYLFFAAPTLRDGVYMGVPLLFSSRLLLLLSFGLLSFASVTFLVSFCVFLALAVVLVSITLVLSPKLLKMLLCFYEHLTPTPQEIMSACEVTLTRCSYWPCKPKQRASAAHATRCPSYVWGRLYTFASLVASCAQRSLRSLFRISFSACLHRAGGLSSSGIKSHFATLGPISSVSPFRPMCMCRFSISLKVFGKYGQ